MVYINILFMLIMLHVFYSIVTVYYIV